MAVLVTTLFGGAAGLLLLLTPLLFESPPEGLARSRPLLVALVALAGLVFGLEWLVVH